MPKETSQNTENNPPLVSVLMPSYNHGEFVENAIRSVWAQTHPEVELIVVDDASSDSTYDKLVTLTAESPIPMRVFRNDVNQGVCQTLNLALSHAEGEWVAFLASDDWYAPQKTARQLAKAEELGDAYGCIHCDSHIADENGKVEGTIYQTSTLPPMEGSAFQSLARGTANMVAVTTMARTEIVRSIGGFDASLRAEDFDFHLRLSSATLYGFVDEPLTYSRTLAGSLGRSPEFYLDDIFTILGRHREALGDQYDDVVVRRSLHAVNICLGHGYWRGVAPAVVAGVKHAPGLAASSKFVARVVVTSAALGGRRVLAPLLPMKLRRRASRMYQSWIYGT